jgi:hypothetical protein
VIHRALHTALVLSLASAPGSDRFTRAFEVAAAGEVVATVRAGCARCAWGAPGREAAALRLSVDGRYSQHLLLARGEAPAEYRVTLGALAAGTHRLTIDRDQKLSAAGAGRASIEAVDFTVLARAQSVEYTAQSRAPILHARPNTVGRFTDLPLLMWYEIVPTPRGRQFRYSVIFSNEDGGTATDRLMATWGRTTDIEFVYGVEVDDHDRVLSEAFQGPGHEVPPFTGRHAARHPLLWVSTDNNMVSQSGPTRVRYAPAPDRVDLTGVSREAVMDAHPWLYGVMAQELGREGKIVDEAPPGGGTVPDPRRFVYVEACGEVGNAALAFAVGVRRARPEPDRDTAIDDWIPSDRGMRQYRIARDGCFRAAIPLPARVQARDIRALRVLAFERAPAEGAPPASSAPLRVARINKVFMLDAQFVPGPSMLRWQGPATLRAGGPPLEIPIP